MNFFKSVFLEDTDTDSDPDSDPDNSPPKNPIKDPNQWSFNTLLNTIATKSESYKLGLEDFTSGLKAETQTIRAAASRAARDLPASIEATAAAAQNSLETVGDAIDSLGSAVSGIISQQTSLALWDEESNNSDSNRDLSLDRPYSRLESLIRAIQCDMNTYCKEVEDLGEYENWKSGFDLGQKTEEIDGLIEENGAIGEIYDEVVPQLVDQQTFWTRYFFKVYKVSKVEDARAKLVKRAIAGDEEEELSWDVDEEDSNDNSKEKEMNNVVEEGEKIPDEKSGSGKDSDFSVVSSQPSMAAEEEIGWDEIEESGSVDEVKVGTSESPNVEELRKRLSAMGKDEDDDEELGWDIEDDDEPLKS